MKKIFFIILITLIGINFAHASEKIVSISEGDKDAKLKIIVYESLTCGACAEFHKSIYPEIKKDFKMYMDVIGGVIVLSSPSP